MDELVSHTLDQHCLHFEQVQFVVDDVLLVDLERLPHRGCLQMDRQVRNLQHGPVDLDQLLPYLPRPFAVDKHPPAHAQVAVEPCVPKFAAVAARPTVPTWSGGLTLRLGDSVE